MSVSITDLKSTGKSIQKSPEAPVVPVVLPIIAAPLKPASLIAVAASTTQLDLNWTNMGGTTAGFRIAYLKGDVTPVDCNSGTVINESQISGTTYSITGLDIGERYSFLVCAVNGAVPPVMSGGVPGHGRTHQLGPAEPNSFLAQVNSSSEILLSWTSGGSFSDHYKIAYQSGATAPADCSSGTVLNQNQIIGTYRNIVGLSANTTYSFRLCSANSNSPPDISTGVTLTATTKVSPPPNPSGLGVSAGGAGSGAMTLSWSSGGGSTTGFKISYWPGSVAPNNCFTGMVVSSVAAPKVVSGLSFSKDYSFRVCAEDATGSLSSGVTITGTTSGSGVAGTPNVLPAAVAPIDGSPNFIYTPIDGVAPEGAILISSSPGLTFRFSYAGLTGISSMKVKIMAGNNVFSDCVGGYVMNYSSEVAPLKPNHYQVSMNDSQGTFSPGLYTVGICVTDAVGLESPVYFYTMTIPNPGLIPPNPIVTYQYLSPDVKFYISRQDISMKQMFYEIQYGGGDPAPCDNFFDIGGYGSVNVGDDAEQTIGFGMAPGSTIKVRFCSNVANYNSSMSSGTVVTINIPATALNPPAEPTGIFSAINENKVTLSWSHGGSSSLHEYLVSFLEGAVAPIDCATNLKVYGESVELALKASTQYSFRVCSQNYNDPSDKSVGITTTATTAPVATLPDGPLGLSLVKANPLTALIHGDFSQTDRVGVRVVYNVGMTPPADCSVGSIAFNGYFGLSGGVSGSSSGLNFEIGPFLASTTYSIRMCTQQNVAYKLPSGANSEFYVFSNTSLVQTFTTTAVSSLSAPINVTSIALSESEVKISWDPVAGATEYLISDSSDCDVSQTANFKSVAVPEAIFTNLMAGERFRFKVCAKNSAGVSPTTQAPDVTTDLAEGILKVATVNLPTMSYGSGFTTLAYVGDLTSDGMDDFVTTIYETDMSSNFKSYIFKWSNGVFDAGLQISSNQDQYTSLASAGDFNFDGSMDFMISAPKTNKVLIRSGKDSATLWSFNGPAASNFGDRMSVINDLNGDQFMDFIISAPTEFISGNSVGKVYIISGKTGLLLYSLAGAQAHENFGKEISVSEDLNSDGLADFYVSSPYFDGTAGVDSGKVSAYSGLDGALIYTVEGGQSISLSGYQLNALNDVNLDGIPDFALSAPWYDEAGLQDRGLIEIRSGANGALISQIKGPTAKETFGKVMENIRDFDKDGNDDLLTFSNRGSDFILSMVSGRLGAITKSFPNTTYGDVFKIVYLGDLSGNSKPHIGLWSGNITIVSPR